MRFGAAGGTFRAYPPSRGRITRSKRPNLGLRHVVAARKVVRREQEDVLDTCLLARTQQSFRTTFRRAEQSKCIGNLVRAVLGDGSRIVRFRQCRSRPP